MRIGFDLDKVLIDTPPFIPDTVIEKLYKKKSNGILLYRIPQKPEQFIRYLSHYKLFRPVMKQNLHALSIVTKEKDDKFYIISSRFGFLKKPTMNIIQRLKFSEIFDGMYFNYKNEQPHEFKDKQIKKLKIERYIDDDLRLIQYLAENNPKTVFYWLNKKEQKKLKKNLIAVTSLNQIFNP